MVYKYGKSIYRDIDQFTDYVSGEYIYTFHKISSKKSANLTDDNLF